ncbi:MAG: alpha/beta fold hydrolase [Actinomycetota bacterium]
MTASLPRWRTGTVTSGGEDIYYEVTGDDDAPAIVLTHGAGGSHAVWYQQVPAFAAAGYRVVTWDCRGFGRSSFRSEVHGTAAVVADLGAVMDACAIDAAHHVGQSMGGWWVAAFALEQDERVRSLALTNTVGGLWTDALKKHFRSWARAFAADGPRLGVHPAIGIDFTHREPARAFLYQQLNTFHEPPMDRVMPALWRTEIAHADLDALGIAILVLTGANDDLFPAALVAESAAQLANAIVVELPDVGHSSYWETPDAYNATVLQFLGPAR